MSEHKRIWLQKGAGDEGSDTWCQDQIADDDIEYILKSEYDKLKERTVQLMARIGECTCIPKFRDKNLIDPTCKYHSYRFEMKALERVLGNGL